MSCIISCLVAVGMHVGSVHMPQDGQNNRNPGAYVRTESGITIGGYRNSIRRTSLYIAKSYEYGPFAATVGGITGYQQKDGLGHSRGAVSPLLALSVKGPSWQGFAPRLAYVPGHLVKASDVVHLTIERKM